MQSAQGQRPKSSKGCAIALAIGGGILLLAGIAVAVLVYLASQNPEVRKMVSLVREGTGAALEARNAPGTEQLRALGCTDAMVFDMERLRRAAEAFADRDGGLGPVDPDEPTIWVACVMKPGNPVPTCDTVASTYLRAAPIPGAPISVSVQVQGQQQPDCARVYAPDGTYLREFRGTPPVQPEGEE